MWEQLSVGGLCSIASGRWRGRCGRCGSVGHTPTLTENTGNPPYSYPAVFSSSENVLRARSPRVADTCVAVGRKRLPTNCSRQNLSAATYQRLRRELDDNQVLEFSMLVGQYVMAAMILDVAGCDQRQLWRGHNCFPRIRYMGSKYRLLPHLERVFAEIGGATAVDVFCGSGVVSYLLERQPGQGH